MIEIRPLEAGDFTALQAFFRRVPDGDRTFFKEDVLDPDVVARWPTASGARRILGVDGDTVCGSISIVRGTAWSSHVGELRLVVDPTYRGRGIGTQLARAGMLAGVEMGLKKLVVEASADQESTIVLFNRLGFEGEALLREHVCTHDGEYRDLIMLAHFVEGVWSELEAVGLADELG